MRHILLALFITGVILQAHAQRKGITYKMQPGAKYAQGRVMVKVKDGFKGLLTGFSAGRTIAFPNFSLRSVSPMVKPELDRAGANLRSAFPGKHSVDISKYYSLTFDPAIDVETAINRLYETGYFELVEPDFVYESDFTPNDPQLAKQYYLNLIKAVGAWDISQGDTSIVIAIVDTGGNLTHEDLAPNLYINRKEYPPNGVDDDGNGFIDDYQGWDFVGADTLNVSNPSFTGDNDPSVHNGGTLSHGTWVAGCASASTNNGKGIAGVGFKSRLLFTKHTADNQKTTNGNEYNVFSGMLYAANLGGVKIINCSFGGSGQSQIAQDLINYIVLDRNCLVVAAAGNSGTPANFYPAAYDNVLSVAATDQTDHLANFSNYGQTIDLAAPGVSITTTGFDNLYNSVNGTSFSAPITSGAAALVWARNPTFTARQVGEQLRVTADPVVYTVNPGLANQIGKGRLDIVRALTVDLPSLRASNGKLVSLTGQIPKSGDKALLYFDFTNFLKSTSSGIQISLSSSSSAISITKSTIAPGIIAGGTTFSSKLTPFELTINPAGQNTVVPVMISFSDGAYTDVQFLSFFVNPTFIDIHVNQILTTMADNGRIGYRDTEGSRVQGSGFVFNQNSMLFEMGLVTGMGAGTVFNNVRGMNNGYDQDFGVKTEIVQVTPGQRSFSEIYGSLNNTVAPTAFPMTLDYRSLVWKDAPYDKFTILEYHITNNSATPYSNYYFGIFADWDITANGANDAAGWDPLHNLGYVYPAQAAAKPYAGIQVLTGSPAYYAIDNDNALAGNPFGVYDGFSDAEKYTTISAAIGSGRERLQAGVSSASGNDVSHVVATGPFSLDAGQTITVAFAVHAAVNLNELMNSAAYADSLYNYTFQATPPVGDSVAICFNSPVTLNASGAAVIHWYTASTGGQPIFTGSQYSLPALRNDTIFYVSNAEHTYESLRTAVKATVRANPLISASGSVKLCQGDSLLLSVAAADTILWSTGAKTAKIFASHPGTYTVTVADKALGCRSSDSLQISVIPKPSASFSTGGTLGVNTSILFTDLSTGAVKWYWDFGDGQVSNSENPTHNYSVPKNYTVSLAVVAADGCADNISSSISVITEIDDPVLPGVNIYPNPTNEQSFRVVLNYPDLTRAHFSLSNPVGEAIVDQDISSSGAHVELEIQTANLPAGVYFVRIQIGEHTLIRKVMRR